MKKRYFSVLIGAAALLLSSCVLAEGETHQKTDAVYPAAQHVVRSVYSYSSLALVVEMASEWYAAESEQERYDLEDEYFEYTKIREKDGVIEVDGRTFVIDTKNKSLEGDAEWSVSAVTITQSDISVRLTYVVKRSESGVYLFDDNMAVALEENVNDPDFVECSIEGDGCVADRYYSGKYEVLTPVTCLKEKRYSQMNNLAQTIGGKILYKSEDAPDDLYITIEPLCEMSLEMGEYSGHYNIWSY